MANILNKGARGSGPELPSRPGEADCCRKGTPASGSLGKGEAEKHHKGPMTVLEAFWTLDPIPAKKQRVDSAPVSTDPASVDSCRRLVALPETMSMSRSGGSDHASPEHSTKRPAKTCASFCLSSASQE